MAAPLLRLKLLVAYDGRPFAGWQSQPDGETVQDKLEAAAARLVGSRVVVHGSGRTDTGVHALGQVAHLEVPADRLPLAQWASALNAGLPPGVRVLRATRAPAGFHARFSATGKRYLYRIWMSPALHPLEIGRVWHVPGGMDLDRLRAAAAALQGRHNFGGFAANRGRVEKDTVRELWSIRTRVRGPLLELHFHGSGFLYRMVRLLTGSMVRCARGKQEVAWLQELLAAEGRIKTRYSCPAEGLYLAKVEYKASPSHHQDLS